MKRYRYSLEFRRSAVDRMNACDSITLLLRELHISADTLYRWRKELEPDEPWASGAEVALSDLSESAVRRQLEEAKRVLAEKTIEVDFFKGALQKVEARRQRNRGSGEKTSTTRSGQ